MLLTKAKLNISMYKSTVEYLELLYIYILIIKICVIGMIEDVGVKLNPGLPWQKLHSTRRRLFLPTNWT